MANLTYEQRRKSRELIPLFLAACGMDKSITTAANEAGVPYWIVHRWTGGNAHLTEKYQPAILAYIEKKKNERNK
jgi:hypothetical protein